MTDYNLTLLKSSYNTFYSFVGQKITYSFNVTNKGISVLTNIYIDDTLLSSVTPHSIPALLPNQSFNFIGTYIVTDNDITNGTILNTATAVAEQISSAPSTMLISYIAEPITLTKTASISSYSVSGQQITYTYTVTNNTGDTFGYVTISDLMPGLSAIKPNYVPTLSAGSSTTFTATYFVTHDDIANGSITNNATASAFDPSGNNLTNDSSVIIPYVGYPLALTKTASLSTFTCPDTIIYYYYTITNVSNQTVTDISITDSNIQLHGPHKKTLRPGESANVTAFYTTTKDDVSNGYVTNYAIVSGKNIIPTETTLTITYDDQGKNCYCRN